MLPPTVLSHSALLFPQRICNVTEVQRVTWYRSFPATFYGLTRVIIHRFGDGVHRVLPEISECLPCVLLPDALLEGLAFVSELNDSLRIGVEGGDRCTHTAGEGSPGHADIKQQENSYFNKQMW